MKRTASVPIFIFALLVSLVGVQSVGLVGANPTVGGYWENSNTVAVPLEITILSPQNETIIASSDLNLTIRITKSVTSDPMEVGQFYISYNLDISPDSPPTLIGQDVVDNDCNLDVCYSTVLHDLNDGRHELLVSVECFPENVSAYWVRTTTYAEAGFYIDTGRGTPTPTLTPTPTPSPEPIPAGEYPEGPRLLWNRTISEWNETAGQYAHSFAVKIIQASDGGYVVTGGSNGSTSGDWYDWWLVKTDSNANMEWEKTFGGPGQDFAHSVIQTSDGGFAIAGTMNGKAAVVKTDSKGNMQWSRTYSNSSHASIIQTSDGGYAIAGDDYTPHPYFTFFGPSPIIRLVKTDALGNEEWSKNYGEGTAVSIVQTSYAGYALMCYGSSGGFLLVKTDSLGEQEYEKTFGVQSDSLLSMVQTSDGEFVVFARALTANWRGPSLIKTDAQGNILWAKNYLRELAIPFDMVATRDGGYVLCASEEWTFEEGDPEGKIIKVDSEGNISWVISLIDGAAGSVVQTFDGGYAFVETCTLIDYEAWEEYYSAVWIIKTEKASSNPTQTPAVTPTQSASASTATPEPTAAQGLTSNAESFPTVLVIASVSVVTVVALGLFVYFKKRRGALL